MMTMSYESLHVNVSETLQIKCVSSPIHTQITNILLQLVNENREDYSICLEK